MIACKHGRDENVKELVAAEDEDVDDALEDGEQTKSRVTIDVKNKHTKAAIHYAARNGHLVSKIYLSNALIYLKGTSTLTTE